MNDNTWTIRSTVTDTGRQISWKTENVVREMTLRTTGDGMNKESKGQRKLEDLGSGSFPEWKDIA